MHLVWGLKVNIMRLDSHVYFTGVSVSRWDDHTPREINNRNYEDNFITEPYEIELSHFLALYEANLIIEIESHSKDYKIRLKSEIEAHKEKASYQKQSLNLHITIDKISENKVEFAWNFMGYKYVRNDLFLGRYEFEKLCKKSNPTIRFAENWNSFVSSKFDFQKKIMKTKLYPDITNDISIALNALENSPNSHEMVCSRMLQITEKYLRKLYTQNNWQQLDNNQIKMLDKLINKYIEKVNPNDEIKSLLKLIVEPHRNHLNHGNPLTKQTSTILIYTWLEVFGELVIYSDNAGLHI